MDLAPVNVAQEMLEGVAVEELLACDMLYRVVLLVGVAVEEVLGADMEEVVVAAAVEEEVVAAAEDMEVDMEEEVVAVAAAEEDSRVEYNKVVYREVEMAGNTDTRYKASYKYFHNSGIPLRS